MEFEVTHTTDYRYATPAAESVGELRVFPVNDDWQTVTGRDLEIEPEVAVDTYIDYYGNRAEWFAIPFRHEVLRIASRSRVRTCVPVYPEPCLRVSVAEARQVARKQQDLYDFRAPSRHVPIGAVLSPLKLNRLLGPGDALVEAINGLNCWIYENFTYASGSTDVNTPVASVVQRRKGVCQDFAHLMLAILRTHGLPCRYVSGYIEPFDPTVEDSKASELVGAAASHAWAEVWLPGGYWIGFDPTNRQLAGERHIRVAVGRDYSDVPPFRGTFKGASGHQLDVAVEIVRVGEESRQMNSE